jgi:hypothetical protein
MNADFQDSKKTKHLSCKDHVEIESHSNLQGRSS